MYNSNLQFKHWRCPISLCCRLHHWFDGYTVYPTPGHVPAISHMHVAAKKLNCKRCQLLTASFSLARFLEGKASVNKLDRLPGKLMNADRAMEWQAVRLLHVIRTIESCVDFFNPQSNADYKYVFFGLTTGLILLFSNRCLILIFLFISHTIIRIGNSYHFYATHEIILFSSFQQPRLDLGGRREGAQQISFQNPVHVKAIKI